MKLGHIIPQNATKTTVESTDETTVWSNDDDNERDWFITGDDDEDQSSVPIEKTVANHDTAIRAHTQEIINLKKLVKLGFEKILTRFDNLESAR